MDIASHAPTGEPLVRGSSKVFYATEDPNVLLMVCADSIHGRGRSAFIPGTGRLREEFCFHFFRLLEARGIPTHLAQEYCGRPLAETEALRPTGILIRRLNMIAIELIARYVARGQWADAHKYPLFTPGEVFASPVFDCSLKWRKVVRNVDAWNLRPSHRLLWKALRRLLPAGVMLSPDLLRDDPRIAPDVLIAMHLASSDSGVRGRLIESLAEWDALRSLCLEVGEVLRSLLDAGGFILEDGKLEVGVLPHGARTFVVADEIGPDCIRVRSRHGRPVTKDLFREGRPAEEILASYAEMLDLVRSRASTSIGRVN